MRIKKDIIFVSLPSYLDGIARILKRRGHSVFYLELSGRSQSGAERAAALRDNGVLPMPLEHEPHLDEVRKIFTNPNHKLDEKTDWMARGKLLKSFERLYPTNADIVGKLRVIIRLVVAGQMHAIAQVNCWAKAHQDREHLLIYPSAYGLLAFDLASNVTPLVIPVDGFINGIGAFVHRIRSLVKPVTVKGNGADKVAVTAQSEKRTLASSRVVVVTHKGLSYGDLFDKTLFYSDRADSELHLNNVLHFDYSGYASPSADIRWVGLHDHRQSITTTLLHFVNAIVCGIREVRSIHELVGLALLAKVYARFKFYVEALDSYPDLRLALIDYEILCPKALLLAFETKGIKSVAVQERFLTSFYCMVGSILDTYLCASEYVVPVMDKSSSYLVDRYIPVGQYKSDQLIEARRLPPPQVLEDSIAQGKKIITALGFHTHMEWHRSQPDSLLSWSAHLHFLKDMVRLADEVSNVFIVLRFKLIDWMSLPVFADIIWEIEAKNNIIISVDYEKPFFSYALCAHSHLVIAKHTSLGDECLAVGTPVLFHEYTHNTQRLIADAFDYTPAHVMCFNYEDLLKRCKTILGSTNNAMTAEYQYLKDVVYSGLGDGKVRDRVHAHIESMLT